MLRPSCPILTFRIGEVQIQCDEEHYQFIINGRVPLLSRREYTLTRELLIQHHEWQAGRREGRYMSISALLERTGTKNPQSLYRLVSDARLKLKPFDLDIGCRWGQGYYVPEV